MTCGPRSPEARRQPPCRSLLSGGSLAIERSDPASGTSARLSSDRAARSTEQRGSGRRGQGRTRRSRGRRRQQRCSYGSDETRAARTAATTALRTETTNGVAAMRWRTGDRFGCVAIVLTMPAGSSWTPITKYGSFFPNRPVAAVTKPNNWDGPLARHPGQRRHHLRWDADVRQRGRRTTALGRRDPYKPLTLYA